MLLECIRIDFMEESNQTSLCLGINDNVLDSHLHLKTIFSGRILYPHIMEAIRLGIHVSVIPMYRVFSMRGNLVDIIQTVI